MHNSDNEKLNKPSEAVKNEPNDALSALWQAQTVTTINLDEVKASLGSERTKQRWYMVLDLLMIVPGIYVFFKYWDNMSYIAQMIILFISISSLPFLAYQLWLRSEAAFYKNAQTADHLAKLTKQIKNNVRIAYMTKHSTWIGMAFGAGLALERLFSGELTSEKLARMVVVMSSISIVMLMWYVWAHKRQKRFERQFETLKSMAQQR
ncbi:hypothetical protein ACI7YQ_19100 [Alteromonas marina]|uniref:hypothetical protein n=1 Tax=unclassified Alteromonas TaxID=2614992 RepID=UPI0012E6AA1A|nr:hypothetical protein [Alteromonas sp. KUL150]GFD72321.1 hypothetical protein KUL113_17410 [Tenacibaculum sp. KUL113]GFD85746.1 hypothetical protein KUL150_18050 [Alteromonas sp. KUL150]|tara:strand:- start:553 stop:1173 length:621 start_codon:yes stop_codon:yes gene_type:complete